MNAPNIERNVKTSSRIRAWWLKTFGGYRVDSVHRTPKAGSFGRIKYDNVYFLVLRDDE